MRLDLFLKTSRLIKSRSLAQEFCDAGLVTVNDATAKSSKEIKAGDEIEIMKRGLLKRLRVDRVPDKKQVSKSQAENLYELLSEAATEQENLLS